jgi:hypothetical protein
MCERKNTMPVHPMLALVAALAVTGAVATVARGTVARRDPERLNGGRFHPEGRASAGRRVGATGLVADPNGGVPLMGTTGSMADGMVRDVRRSGPGISHRTGRTGGARGLERTGLPGTPYGVRGAL